MNNRIYTFASNLVVAIGCGLAGYKPGQIAWMFNAPVPRNVNLPPEFLEFIQE